MEKNNKAQALSTDLIVVMALVLFSAIFVVFTQINNQQDASFEQRQEESKVVSDSIYNSLTVTGIIGDNNVVNLEELKQIDEDEIRRQLGINRDFAIAFEKDGKLIYIDAEDNVSCIGSNKIIINERNCGFRE